MRNISIKNDAGLFTLALRLVVGWTYFSAFWRRVALANKLDPEIAGYIGEKFKDLEDRQPEKFKKLFAEFVLNDIKETVNR